jgi:hypothetical protein
LPVPVGHIVVHWELMSNDCYRPINTYAHRGVAKGGVKKHEHSIIYTGRNTPKPEKYEKPGRNEFGMLPSIRVTTPSRINILEPMSRVCYSKVYTFEHNLKVEEFGKVHDEFIHKFVENFDTTLATLRALRNENLGKRDYEVVEDDEDEVDEDQETYQTQYGSYGGYAPTDGSHPQYPYGQSQIQPSHDQPPAHSTEASKAGNDQKRKSDDKYEILEAKVEELSSKNRAILADFLHKMSEKKAKELRERLANNPDEREELFEHLFGQNH